MVQTRACANRRPMRVMPLWLACAPRWLQGLRRPIVMGQCEELLLDRRRASSRRSHAPKNATSNFLVEDFRILLLALCLGAVESLMPVFLASSSKTPKPSDVPLLMRFAWPESCPALSAAQFLSSLFAGEHLAVRLLCGARDTQRVADFIMWDPEAALHLRMSLAVSAVFVHIRFFHRFAQWPWRAASIANPTLDIAARRAVAGELIEACPKCLDHGFAQQLRARVGGATDLLSSQWCAVVNDWARAVVLDTHSVELAHAFHRRSATPLSKFETLAGRSVNSQAMRAVEEARAAHAIGDASSAATPRQGPPVKRRKAFHAGQAAPQKSGLQLFHAHCCRRDKATGSLKGKNPCSRQYWEEVRAEWQELSPETRRQFVDLQQIAAVAAASDARDQAISHACVSVYTPPIPTGLRPKCRG